MVKDYIGRCFGDLNRIISFAKRVEINKKIDINRGINGKWSEQSDCY